MTLDDIFNAARDAARHPGEAMAIDDLRAELQGVLDTAADAGLDPGEIPGALDDLKALREHVKGQWFTVEHDTRLSVVTDKREGAFEEWLGELERLAE
jgi:hypothetical protein